jgi:hypothetical protein
LQGRRLSTLKLSKKAARDSSAKPAATKCARHPFFRMRRSAIVTASEAIFGPDPLAARNKARDCARRVQWLGLWSYKHNRTKNFCVGRNSPEIIVRAIEEN